MAEIPIIKFLAYITRRESKNELPYTLLTYIISTLATKNTEFREKEIYNIHIRA
jgi:hypothetical protein